MTVSLDTALTPELRAEGMARELIRAVQNLRKKSGLAVAHRIHLGIEAPDRIRSALEPFLDWISSEVLAVSVVRGSVDAPDGKADVTLDGERVTISLKRA